MTGMGHGPSYGRRVIVIATNRHDGAFHVRTHLGAAAVAILTPRNARTATRGIVATEVVFTERAMRYLTVQQRLHLAEVAAPSLATTRRLVAR